MSEWMDSPSLFAEMVFWHHTMWLLDIEMPHETQNLTFAISIHRKEYFRLPNKGQLTEAEAWEPFSKASWDISSCDGKLSLLPVFSCSFSSECLVMCYGSCDEAHITLRWWLWKKIPGQVRKNNEVNWESRSGKHWLFWKVRALYQSPSIYSRVRSRERRGNKDAVPSPALLSGTKERQEKSWGRGYWVRTLGLS